MRMHSWAAVLVVCGMVMGATAAEPARDAKAAAVNAPKWEYKTLTKGEIADLGGSDFATGLNRLGDDGWELVAVEPHVRSDGWERRPAQTTYYFKRPAARAAASAPPASAEFKVFALKNAEAGPTAKAIDKILGGVAISVVADDRTNQLLVRGSTEDLLTVSAILERLDVPAAK